MAGRVLLAVLALVAATSLPAYAHRNDPTVVARLDAVEPPIDGVVVEVRSGVADQLLVVNMSADPVEVLGANGAAFLRIANDSVEADVASDDWASSMSPFGPRRGPGGPPRWTTVAAHGSWGWFDHRMHDRDRPLPGELRGAKAPVRLADWTVALRHNGSAHLVKGHVEYRPVTGAFRSRVTTKPDGADVDVLDGRVPGVFLRWHGGGTLLVRGADGEPFARFTNNGVEVNARSGTWREDRLLRGEAFEVRPPGEPVWTRQGSGPSLTWLDRRLAYTPGVPPDDVLRRDDPTTMVEWDLPVEVAGRDVAVSGETTWHPNATRTGRDAGRTAVVAGVAAAAALVVATLAARGRRRRRVEQ